MASHALDLCLYMKRWVDRSPETCERRNTCFSELEMHRREDIRLQKAMRKTRHEYARQFIKLHLQVVRDNTNILMNRIQLYNIVKNIEEATQEALNSLNLDPSLKGNALEDGLLKFAEENIQNDKGRPEGVSGTGTASASKDTSDSEGAGVSVKNKENASKQETEDTSNPDDESKQIADHNSAPQKPPPEQNKVEKFIQGKSKLSRAWEVIKNGMTNKWVIILFMGALTAAYVASYGIEGIVDFRPWIQGYIDGYNTCETSEFCTITRNTNSTDYIYHILNFLGKY